MKLKQLTRRIVSALVLALALSVFMGAGALAETVVAGSKIRVYQMPDEAAASIAIPAGTCMEKVAVKGAWMQVKRAGVTAYVPANAVQDVVDCRQAEGHVIRATPMYRQYGSPETYGKLPEGAEVTVYALAGEWAWVGIGRYKGFVRKDTLSAGASELPVGDTDGGAPVVLENQHAYASVEGAKVYKSASSSAKVKGCLPVNTRLAVGAVRGEWALVELNGFYGFMQRDTLSPEKVDVPEIPDLDPSDEAGDEPFLSGQVPEGASQSDSNAVPARGTAKAMDWWTSGIQEIFARGTTATITDVATGIAWKEMRKGGTNHADTQPLTAEDTAAMKAAVGDWSWARRAVIVTIDGVNYAASMNCMPHGSGSISTNNFDGHHCIHFTNSRTHSSNKVCELHQAAIQRALAAKL